MFTFDLAIEPILNPFQVLHQLLKVYYFHSTYYFT